VSSTVERTRSVVPSGAASAWKRTFVRPRKYPPFSERSSTVGPITAAVR